MITAKKARKMLQNEKMEFARKFEEEHPDIIKQFEKKVTTYAKIGSTCMYCEEILGIYDKDDFLKYVQILGYKIKFQHCVPGGNAFEISF